MYLREMGTVPLLTREGEVEIARRIERGKLAVIKSISRTPLVAQKVIAARRPAAHRRSHHSRARHLQRRGDHRRAHRRAVEAGAEADRSGPRRPARRRRSSTRSSTRRPKGATTSDKRKYRKARWAAMRARIELSQRIREIEFTESVKRRLIDEMKDAVEGVKRRPARDRGIDRLLIRRTRSRSSKEDDRKNITAPEQRPAGSSSRR